MALTSRFVISCLDYCNSLMAIKGHSTSAAYPQCSSPAVPQPTHVPPHNAPLPRTVLWRPASGCTDRIQGTGACLPSCKWLRPILHPGHDQTIYSRVSAMLYDYQTASFVSLRGGPPRCRSAKSLLVAVLAPQLWNEFPTYFRTVKTLHVFTVAEGTHLAHDKKM